MAGERQTDELDMECEWCGFKFDPDKEDCWDDGEEHYFCSEMCLGQFEAEGGNDEYGVKVRDALASAERILKERA